MRLPGHVRPLRQRTDRVRMSGPLPKGKIVHPSSNYREALVLANLDTLSSRRESLCQKFVSSMRNCPDHPLSFLCPNVEYVNVPYNLRSGHKKSITRRFRTKRTEDFLTFKY